jgi:hypothetical protein
VTDRAGRWIYAIEALAIGVPTLVYSGIVLFLAIPSAITLFLNGVTEGNEACRREGAVLFSLGCSGAIGLTAWTVLSRRYLSGGRQTLNKAGHHWWIGLAVGMALAAYMLYPKGGVAWSDWLPQVGSAWLMGPALLLPAMHLICLKYRSWR